MTAVDEGLAGPAAGATPARLAVALVAGPAAWFARLSLSSALVPLACDEGATWLLHVVALLTAAVAVAGIAAVAVWRKRARAEPVEDDRSGILTFLLVGGLLVNGISLMLILMESAPIFFIDPCI